MSGIASAHHHVDRDSEARSHPDSNRLPKFTLWTGRAALLVIVAWLVHRAASGRVGDDDDARRCWHGRNGVIHL